MLKADHQGLYYYHLKKTGGSTFNHWLDTLTFGDRRCQSGWIGSWLMEGVGAARTVAEADSDTSLLRAVFNWSDVVHTHTPLRRYVPAGTLCFTVLRDPVQRVVSQVSDWRRHKPDVTDRMTSAYRNLIADSNRLRLCDHLAYYARQEGRWMLDNYMTRALAAVRLGRAALFSDADALLDVALSSLENDYDLIGLTEKSDISRNALCATAGLPPARAIRHLNRSRTKQGPDPEVEEASGILQTLTGADRILYARACALFDQRHRQAGEAYDTEAFESRHAARVLGQQRGTWRDGATSFSVRLPIIGSGFHGRDAPGTPACAVWSGPATCLTLYMPVPPGLRVSLLIWIRGYAAQRQRDQIRVRVDGHPADHQFRSAEGYADLLTIDARPLRDFVRLEVEVDETLTSIEAGREGLDERKRGFAFDSYGWRPD